MALCSLLLTVASIILIAQALPINQTLQHHTKIVGGYLATINNFPYQVSIQYYGQHSCGGSILDERTILTAAHCAHGYVKERLAITAGSTYHNRGGQLIPVKDVRIHKNYNANTSDNDVCILKLASPINIDNKSTRPIALTDQEVPAGSYGCVSGWGHLTPEGNAPKDLRAVNVPLITRNKCFSKYKGKITTRMICAGYDDGGKDSCQGDSGGPLVIDGKQIGIVSWGYGCADPRFPGVYTNVANEDIKNFILGDPPKQPANLFSLVWHTLQAIFKSQ